MELENFKDVFKEKAIHNFKYGGIFALISVGVGLILQSPPFLIFLLGFVCIHGAILATLFDLSYAAKVIRRHVDQQAKKIVDDQQARKDAFFNAHEDRENYDA